MAQEEEGMWRVDYNRLIIFDYEPNGPIHIFYTSVPNAGCPQSDVIGINWTVMERKKKRRLEIYAVPHLHHILAKVEVGVTSSVLNKVVDKLNVYYNQCRKQGMTPQDAVYKLIDLHPAHVRVGIDYLRSGETPPKHTAKIRAPRSQMQISATDTEDTEKLTTTTAKEKKAKVLLPGKHYRAHDWPRVASDSESENDENKKPADENKEPAPSNNDNPLTVEVVVDCPQSGEMQNMLFTPVNQLTDVSLQELIADQHDDKASAKPKQSGSKRPLSASFPSDEHAAPAAKTAANNVAEQSPIPVASPRPAARTKPAAGDYSNLKTVWPPPAAPSTPVAGAPSTPVAGAPSTPVAGPSGVQWPPASTPPTKVGSSMRWTPSDSRRRRSNIESTPVEPCPSDSDSNDNGMISRTWKSIFPSCLVLTAFFILLFLYPPQKTFTAS